MLTIGQLAAHAGVTVRAVRHYHRIGLLPEPERDQSGYRTYTADAVVRLIRIHILAGAGVPLARVQELLEAGPEEFAAAVQEIDRKLRTQIRQLQATRQRLAKLSAGEQLALPDSVLGYLDRLRGLGVEERYSSSSVTRGSSSPPRRPTRSTTSSPRSTRSSTTPRWSGSTGW